VVDRYLAGVDAVAVVDGDDGTLAIVPLRGGLILEQRNLRGDRVVQAIEALRGAGIDEAVLSVCWDPGRGALVARGLSR
jgi:hypothetical protein